MAIEVLTIEVGSTITKVIGFARLPGGGFSAIARGFAPTSLADVGIGVDQALADLKQPWDQAEIFINSSAAGGLRMTVHGLTASMTARAAKEAALGAGAIVKLVTVGPLDAYQLDDIKRISPNLILLAGGVDHGERHTVLENAHKLANMGLNIPVLYAGNIDLQRPVVEIFGAGRVEIAENIFPEVDVLNIEPLRRLIHEAFNRHIIHAPGMERLGQITKHPVLPTPGAVLLGAELFAKVAGDCMVFDVGGATTDVHSVTQGDPKWYSSQVQPEPLAKRTVEGDLGVFVNAANLAKLALPNQPLPALEHLAAVPKDKEQIELTRWLCCQAVEIAAKRHAGTVSQIYTPTGRRTIVKGKDLTAVSFIIATGGALTQVPGAVDCIKRVCTGAKDSLLPEPGTTVLVDEQYIFSALGTLAQFYPDDVAKSFNNFQRR